MESKGPVFFSWLNWNSTRIVEGKHKKTIANEQRRDHPILERPPSWWFQIFFMFTPSPGEMIQFDEYFSNRLKPPTSHIVSLLWSCFFWCLFTDCTMVNHGFHRHFAAPVGEILFGTFSKHRTCKSNLPWLWGGRVMMDSLCNFCLECGMHLFFLLHLMAFYYIW